jgi:hypothetical protein
MAVRMPSPLCRGLWLGATQLKRATFKARFASTSRYATSFSSASTTSPDCNVDGAGVKRLRPMGKYARRGLADILVVKEGRAIFPRGEE